MDPLVQKKIRDEIVRRVLERDEKKQIMRVEEADEIAAMETLQQTTSLTRAEIEAIARQVHAEMAVADRKQSVREAIEADKRQAVRLFYYFLACMGLLVVIWFFAPMVALFIGGGILAIFGTLFVLLIVAAANSN